MLLAKRINSLKEFKELENPTENSKFKDAKWTVDKPLILEHQTKGIILVDKWFITNGNELVYSNENDFFNIDMYEGILKPSSWIENVTFIYQKKEQDNE